MPWPRKRHRAQQLASGEDVFHDYRWPVKDTPDAAPANGPGGRPRFNWTPRRSRELIRLIIHTDIRFDDIAAAMRDETGHGPSESTCRDHWHEIFGYTPDVARLKNPAGRERRFKEHEKAFKAYCSLMVARNHYSTIRAEKDADLDDSFEVAPDTNAEVPEVQRKESEKSQQARSLLSPVQHLRRTIASPHEHKTTTRQADASPAEPSSSDAKPECPRDVEKKYGLPQGFIPWIKGASISSTESIRRISANTMQSVRRLSSRPRFESGANVTSHPIHRQSSVPARASILCNYLSSLKPEDEVSASQVERLINQGENVNKANENGETPLHLAVALGSIVVVAMLLEHGADPDRVTLTGESIWARGRRASVAAIDPNAEDDYERRRMEIQRMLCARIEFARTTVRYNPGLITDQKPTKRPRNAGSMPATLNTLSQVEEVPPHTDTIRARRPRFESSSSHVNWGSGAEVPDDSVTTDSDLQTRSSSGPYTPETIGARNSTDTDWSDIPRFPAGNILTGHGMGNPLIDQYVLPGPRYSSAYGLYSVSNTFHANITGLPAYPHYGSDSRINLQGYGYEASVSSGMMVPMESIKATQAQATRNSVIPDLNIQSPQGDTLAPNIDFATNMFDQHTPLIHAERSGQMLPPPLPQAMVTPDADSISPFQTGSEPAHDEGILLQTSQPGFHRSAVDFSALAQYPNFDLQNSQVLHGGS